MSTKELETLLSLTGDEKSQFETISENFRNAFAKVDHFKVGFDAGIAIPGISNLFRAQIATVLCVVLEGEILSPTQRLAAFYIIYDLYRKEAPAHNPFLPVFLEFVDHSSSAVERNFLLNLIGYQHPEVHTASPFCLCLPGL